MNWDKFIADVERGQTGVEHSNYIFGRVIENVIVINDLVEERDEARRWARIYRSKYLKSLQERLSLGLKEMCTWV